MIFTNKAHAHEWAQAVEQTEAQRSNGTVNSYFGASLFIITGVPGMFERVKHHLHSEWIDFDAILDMGLSSGESVLVELAGNFYNGRFFKAYTPCDLVDRCDGGMLELAAKALWLRKQRIDVNTIFD